MAFENIGIKRIMEHGQRMNNYLKSIDQGLTKVGNTFNQNTKIINSNLKELSDAIQELKEGQIELAKGIKKISGHLKGEK